MDKNEIEAYLFELDEALVEAFTSRKLHLYLPTDISYILACKLMAGRPDKDYGDIHVLRQHLGIHTREQAQVLVNRFFPNLYTQRIHQLSDALTEIFPEK